MANPGQRRKERRGKTGIPARSGPRARGCLLQASFLMERVSDLGEERGPAELVNEAAERLILGWEVVTGQEECSCFCSTALVPASTLSLALSYFFISESDALVPESLWIHVNNVNNLTQDWTKHESCWI